MSSKKPKIIAVHAPTYPMESADSTPTGTETLDLSQVRSMVVTPDYINIDANPTNTITDEDTAREMQNAEFLNALESRRSTKNKLPLDFGNRKERRRLEALVKRNQKHGRN